MVVELTIQPSGAVTGARATESSTASEAAAACAVSTVAHLQLDRAPKGGSVTYAYPLTLTPQ